MEKDLNLWAEAVEETIQYLTRKAVTNQWHRPWRGVRRNVHQQMSPAFPSAELKDRCSSGDLFHQPPERPKSEEPWISGFYLSIEAYLLKLYVFG